MRVSAEFPRRRLKYAATINDEALTDETSPDYELQYVDIGNVDSSGAIHEIASYRFEFSPSRARRIVRGGDVIISTVRTYLQAIAPIQDPPDNLIVSTGFAVVRPRPSMLDANFCKFALREPEFLTEVEMRSVGVSYPASFPGVEDSQIRIFLAPRRQERQVTGQGPSSRVNARDLRKISPFGRNDNARPLRLCARYSDFFFCVLCALCG